MAALAAAGNPVAGLAAAGNPAAGNPAAGIQAAASIRAVDSPAAADRTGVRTLCKYRARAIGAVLGFAAKNRAEFRSAVNARNQVCHRL